MTRLAKPVTTLALVIALGCASVAPVVPGSSLAAYRRLFLTMPSHYAGFGVGAAVTIGPGGHGASPFSLQDAVRRAFEALRSELTDAGFDVVARDEDADAVLELTMSGIEADGEAERAFVAFRDAQSGRLLATFRAQSREDPQAVEELMQPLAEAIEETIHEPLGQP